MRERAERERGEERPRRGDAEGRRSGMGERGEEEGKERERSAAIVNSLLILVRRSNDCYTARSLAAPDSRADASMYYVH